MGEGELPYHIIPIALVPSDRAQLHARIATRFKAMLEQGLVDELRTLREKYPLHPNMTSMRCVGYRQAWQFLEGDIDECATAGNRHRRNAATGETPAHLAAVDAGKYRTGLPCA